MWIEPSTVRDGIAARVVDRHADETRVVRVTRIRTPRDEAAEFEPGVAPIKPDTAAG